MNISTPPTSISIATRTMSKARMPSIADGRLARLLHLLAELAGEILLEIARASDPSDR